MSTQKNETNIFFPKSNLNESNIRMNNSVDTNKWKTCLKDMFASNFTNQDEYQKLNHGHDGSNISLSSSVPAIYGQILTSEQIDNKNKKDIQEPIYSKIETVDASIPNHYAKVSGPNSTRDQFKNLGKLPSLRPIQALTLNILRTYKRINEVYLEKYQRPEAKLISQHAPNNNHYDSGLGSTLTNSSEKSSYVISLPPNQIKVRQGPISHIQTNNSKNQNHLESELLKVFTIDTILVDRYKLVKMIGAGTFGQVFHAKDLESGEDVAVKVIRKRSCFIRQAVEEIKNLHHIAQFQQRNLDETGIPGAEHFAHDHLCLVMDLLAGNLFQLLKNTQYRGVSLSLTRKFGAQLCEALAFLSHPQVNIIHCDLKPENIIMVNLKRSAIKVIDFGSSCRLEERLFQYIQSRFYRSPEVIFGLEYGFPIDMWSLGCILVELHTGDPLFPGENELDQLLKIIEVFGMPPVSMIEASPKRDIFFERLTLSEIIKLAPGEQFAQLLDSDIAARLPKECVLSSKRSSVDHSNYVYKPRRIWTNSENVSFECKFSGPQSKPLPNIVGVYTKGPIRQHANKLGHEWSDYKRFLDLIQCMLRFLPEERIRPQETLQHIFFTAYSTTVQPPKDQGTLVLVKEPNLTGSDTNFSTLPPGYVVAVDASLLSMKEQYPAPSKAECSKSNSSMDTRESSPNSHHEDTHQRLSSAMSVETIRKSSETPLVPLYRHSRTTPEVMMIDASGTHTPDTFLRVFDSADKSILSVKPNNENRDSAFR